MGNEARIKIGVDGAGQASKEIRDVGAGIRSLGQDAIRASTGMKGISFQEVASHARKADEIISRMAVNSGQGVGELREKFARLGKEILVMPSAVASATRELGKLTYAPRAAQDAIAALGLEANNSDRSLEEMVEVGATMRNRLGVPLDKVGDTLRDVKIAAKDLSTIGGHLALEDSLTRLASKLARFQGGVRRAIATVGVLGKGLPKEEAEQVTDDIMSGIEHADPLLLTRTMRRFKGRNYNPYTHDAQGRVVIKKEVPALVQKIVRQSAHPMAVAMNLLGVSGTRGVQAAERFLNADFSEIDAEEQHLSDEEEARAFKKLKTRKDMIHRGRPAPRIKGYGTASELSDYVSSGAFHPDEGSADRFADTSAGQDIRSDIERAGVESKTGQAALAVRRQYERAMIGNPGGKAVLDTLADLGGDTIGTAIRAAVAGASGVSALQNGTGRSGDTVGGGADPGGLPALTSAIQKLPTAAENAAAIRDAFKGLDIQTRPPGPEHRTEANKAAARRN